MSASDIERENLEAHVELCAERYRQLNNKLDTLDSKVTAMEAMVLDIKESLQRDKNTKSNAVLGFLVSLVLLLGGTILTMVTTFK
jgi:multidrug resistance efflux pump